MSKLEPASSTGTRTDPASYHYLEALVEGQSQVLEMISQGQSLSSILGAVTRWVEAQSRDGALASVLLLDRDELHLRHGAAPSLPDTYSNAIDGIEIGPSVGSCGTAAFTREPVTVEDIAQSPLWADFRELALSHGLRACWSTPLIGHSGRVLGTFAMYYRHARVPTEDDLHIIRLVSRTVILAIEQKQAEEERERLLMREQLALLQAETERRRLHDILMDAPAVIAILRGPDHVYTLANPLYMEAVGKDRDILGKSVRDALPELEGQGFYELLDRVYVTGEPFVGKELLVRLDRHGNGVLEDVYFNFVYQPSRDATGAVDGILAHAVDVTELVQARQRVEESEDLFRTLANNISQFAWMADETGSIFWYNQRWYDYTGTTPEEVYGWGWQKVHHPDHLARVVERISRCFQTGELWEDTFPLRSKDGEYRWFLSRAIPIRDASGKVIRWFGTNTDITEQRLLDQKKDEFIAIASHELKTPVTSVKALAQLLARRSRASGDERSAGMLEKMDRQLDRLNKLISDLLDETRIERGKLTLDESVFDYGELMTDVIEEVQRTAQRHTIICENAPSVTLFADRERLGQVLANLLTNAVKYSPDADRVIVSATVCGGELITRVRDFGIGIPREKQRRVFDRFFRVESLDNQEYPGLGLGLYISAEIIRLHGGRIWVESEEGRGSIFAFALSEPVTVEAAAT